MKKGIFLLLIIALSNFYLYSQSNNSIGYTGVSDLNIVDVSESVSLLHNEKLQGSNMTCIALDDGLVFFDCSFFTEIASEFRKLMEEKYQKKTLALVQTHFHTDHFFGMHAFSDVPFISSKKAINNCESQLSIDYEKYKNAYKAFFPLFDKAVESCQLRKPAIWFDGELVLGSANSKLILRDAGGHSECSIYAYFEKDSVLIAGDDIQVDYHLYFGDPTGNIPTWIETLKKWESMGIEHVCGGHGPVAAKEYIFKTRTFLENLLAEFEAFDPEKSESKQLIEKVNKIDVYWPSDLEKPMWYDPAILRAYKIYMDGK